MSDMLTSLRLPQASPRVLTGPDRSRLGFGDAFTSSMVTATWTEDQGWSKLELAARRPLEIDPAMVAIHYGQIVFEGLKAHRLPDGRIAIFRPEAYAERMQKSAARFAMPEPPLELFIDAVTALAGSDADWLPDDPAAALYIRPVLVASEPSLALRPSRNYFFFVIAFVTGGFFSDTPEPITVKLERNYVRAFRGGTGDAKCPGNYAPTYLAQGLAQSEGSQQVVWLDAVERRWIEELGGMNLFFIHGSGSAATLSTPPLSSTILPGVTRDSLIHVAQDLGYGVDERPIDISEWYEGCRNGRITETFACGTAATVTPVGRVDDADRSWQVGNGVVGPITLRLRDALRKAWMGESARGASWITIPDVTPTRGVS